MSVENLIEARVKEPQKYLFDKNNDKYGYTGIQSSVLVDADDNVIFYGATKYDAMFYYVFKCKNVESEVNEISDLIRNITEDSPCYNLPYDDFPELHEQKNFFYRLKNFDFYDFSSLNDELEEIQNQIEFLNYDNALEKSLESLLKDMKFSFDPDPYYNPNASDEMWEIRENYKKISFLGNMDFLLLSKNENIRNWYKRYLSGISEFSRDCLQFGK